MLESDDQVLLAVAQFYVGFRDRMGFGRTLLELEDAGTWRIRWTSCAKFFDYALDGRLNAGAAFEDFRRLGANIAERLWEDLRQQGFSEVYP